MKTKFKHDELSGLGFKEYRNMLYKELARLKKDNPDGAQPVEFLMIGQFKFIDTGDKKLPLVIVGDRDAQFAKYVKETVLKRTERDFAVGTCGFGKAGQFNVIIKRGKIASSVETAANKLIFEPAKLSLAIVESLEAEEDTEVVAAAAVATAATETVAKEEKKGKGKQTKEEKIAAVKEQATEELKALGAALAACKAAFKAVETNVAPKIKSGEAVTQKEQVLVKRASELCDAYDAQYKKASKPAQKEAGKGAAEVAKVRKDLQKVAAAVQQKKVTLAQTLADKFFMKNAKRAARENEVAMMQAALVAAIADSELAKMEAAERESTLKAIYLTAALLGPKFKYAQVKVVAAKLAA